MNIKTDTKIQVPVNLEFYLQLNLRSKLWISWETFLPTCVVWWTASYVNVPDLETTPTIPFWWMCPGIIPILHCSGAMIPGQLGPMSRDLFCLRSLCLTLTMSCCGIPVNKPMKLSNSIFAVFNRHTFSNAYNKWHFCIYGFIDGSSGTRRWYIDYCSIGTSGRTCLENEAKCVKCHFLRCRVIYIKIVYVTTPMFL